MPNHLAPAIILDLDQTLASLNGRNPYDASTCEQDTLNAPVWNLVDAFLASHPQAQTIIVTGRPYKHRAQTKAWLKTHGITYTALHTREDGDWSAAAFYKWHIYKLYIENQYRIEAVFDDNPTVCRMFAEEGLPVFRVGNHRERFAD